MSAASSTEALLRLGAIHFVNSLPIYDGLSQQFDLEGDAVSVQIKYGLPSQLNRLMRQGHLDCSPVSSAFYLQNNQNLLLMPGLSISSFGSVESVVFVSKTPWGPDLQSLETIAVPDSSASSIQLLDQLLETETGQPLWSRFKRYKASQWEAALEQTGHALIIGDEALRFFQTPYAETFHAHDLATLWTTQNPGLPFVFAVWVCQPSYQQSHPARAQAAMDWLCANRDRLFQDEARALAALAQETALSYCGTAEQLFHYWTHALNFGWSSAHEDSLLRFGARLKPFQLDPLH